MPPVSRCTWHAGGSPWPEDPEALGHDVERGPPSTVNKKTGWRTIKDKVNQFYGLKHVDMVYLNWKAKQGVQYEPWKVGYEDVFSPNSETDRVQDWEPPGIDATSGHTLDYRRFQAVLVLQVSNPPTNNLSILLKISRLFPPTGNPPLLWIYREEHVSSFEGSFSKSMFFFVNSLWASGHRFPFPIGWLMNRGMCDFLAL